VARVEQLHPIITLIGSYALGRISLLIVGDQVLGIPLAPEHRWRDGLRLPSLRPYSLDLQLPLKNLASANLLPTLGPGDSALRRQEKFQ
jgi:hypothetical protein